MAKDEMMDPNDLVIIGVDTPHEAKDDHPLYDERIGLPLDDALVRNIMVYGVQVPVLVREDDGQLQVVDGRQRVRAAREAANRQATAGEMQVRVPIMHSRGDDARIVGIMISTNEQRKEDDMLTKAFKAVRAFDFCRDIDMVAVQFGKSPQTIRQWMEVAEAHPEVHDAIRDGKITFTGARDLAKWPRDEQPGVLKSLIKATEAGGGSTVTTQQAKAQAVQAGKSKATPKGSRRSPQKGVKRTWLRKALKTEAAKGLEEDQLGVLKWIANGESDDMESWWEQFQWDVSQELGED